MEAIKEDMKVVGITIEDAGTDQSGKTLFTRATHNWEKLK